MFEKKKKATKSEDLMKKAPSLGAVELSDDVLEAAAGGWNVRPYFMCSDGGNRPGFPWCATGVWPDGTPCKEWFRTEGEAKSFVVNNNIQ